MSARVSLPPSHKRYKRSADQSFHPPLDRAEEFDSELEKMNVSLVLENQALQAENRGLSSLLKDYEGTLEAVMGKFRAHAVRPLFLLPLEAKLTFPPRNSTRRNNITSTSPDTTNPSSSPCPSRCPHHPRAPPTLRILKPLPSTLSTSNSPSRTSLPSSEKPSEHCKEKTRRTRRLPFSNHKTLAERSTRFRIT